MKWFRVRVRCVPISQSFVDDTEYAILRGRSKVAFMIKSFEVGLVKSLREMYSKVTLILNEPFYR